MSKSNTKCLLLGSSLIRGVDDATTRDGRPVIIKKHSGAKYSDLTRALDEVEDDSISSIVVVAGTREVDSDVSLDSVKGDITSLITKAKQRFTEVSLSSVLPRVDRDVEDRQKLVNNVVSEACTELEVTYINNDDNFLFRNGTADTSSFQKDGVHLSAQGTTKLMTNLKLNPVSRSSQSTVVRQHQPRLNQRMQRSYSEVVRNKSSLRSQARCWFCAEPGHTKEQCGHGKKIQCNRCKRFGHKSKFCSN